MVSTTSFAIIAASLLGLALAAPQNMGPFHLRVQSSDSSIDGSYLTIKQEGDNIGWAFADTDGSGLFFYEKEYSIQCEIGFDNPYTAYITEHIFGDDGVDFLLFHADDQSSGDFIFDDAQHLVYNGGTDWVICTKHNDPNDVALPAIGKSTPGIAITNPSCNPIEIIREFD